MAKHGPKPFTREQMLKRFWERVDVIPDLDSCWPWLGSCSKAGYGTVQARAVSPQPLYAHRIMWELAYGPIPEGMDVLHKCDNPPCCRPKHFFLGTQQDNNSDRDSKGRTASGPRNGAKTKPEKNPFVKNHGSALRGEKHPQCFLSDSAVDLIRTLYAQGETTKACLARTFGVSQTHIARIINRRNRA